MTNTTTAEESFLPEIKNAIIDTNKEGSEAVNKAKTTPITIAAHSKGDGNDDSDVKIIQDGPKKA